MQDLGARQESQTGEQDKTTSTPRAQVRGQSSDSGVCSSPSSA